MWTCPNCGRIFEKAKQPHSCRKIPLEEHFKNKSKAKELFDLLHKRIGQEIGSCRIISIPCCIHLFGHYDFLAALPKKDRLEIRFALDEKLNSPRLKQGVAMSNRIYKNCTDISSSEDIDEDLVGWLTRSFHLKD
jgi:hypothetical protein